MTRLSSQLSGNAKQLKALGLARLGRIVEGVAVDAQLQAEFRRVDDGLRTQRRSNRIGGPWVQGYVIEITSCLDFLFGKKMYGVSAAIANVVFELNRKPLTEDRIRGVFRRTNPRR